MVVTEKLWSDITPFKVLGAAGRMEKPLSRGGDEGRGGSCLTSAFLSCSLSVFISLLECLLSYIAVMI